MAVRRHSAHTSNVPTDFGVRLHFTLENSPGDSSHRLDDGDGIAHRVAGVFIPYQAAPFDAHRPTARPMLIDFSGNLPRHASHFHGAIVSADYSTFVPTAIKLVLVVRTKTRQQ